MGDFEVGEVFADRYEIIEELGRGGMGMVYLVNDRKTQKRLALKTLLPRYTANKQAVRRFAREVNASRRIDHPCVVKIFDAGEVDEILFYTMEYIEGKSVRAWMRERKKSTGRAFGLGSTVRILSMLCSALEHAHKFTIHRDLSPENVMVMKDGTIKLLDFGLAKLESTDADLTRIGVSLGKIQYSAPEQRVDAKNVDLRADIYSLGVMFYEMLSGKLPTDGTLLTQRVPGLPPEVDAFVARCMAEKPEDRFESATKVRQALKLIYDHAKAMRAERKKPAQPVRSGSSAAEDGPRVVSSSEKKRSNRELGRPAIVAVSSIEGKRSKREPALPSAQRERPRGPWGRFWHRLFRRPKV